MGCLLEFITEIVAEGVIEFFAYCYLQMMLLIVPDKAVSEKAKKIAIIIATTKAASADQTLSVAPRIAGKVITASVTKGT